MLIERQPCRWANRKILSGLRTEPTNQPGRGAEAFWSRGDAWGERTGASAGSAPHYRWILLQRHWWNPVHGEREAPAGAEELRVALAMVLVGLASKTLWMRGAWPPRSKAGGLAAIPCTRTSLKIQNGLLCTYICWLTLTLGSIIAAV